MLISKDIETYLNSLGESAPIVKTIEQCSMNAKKIPMVNNRKMVYDFDAVVKALFKGDTPSSVDCVCVTKNSIDLIEFKDGMIDRYDKEYKEPEYTCQECKRLHKESFEYFIETRKKQKKILDQNLRMKASESLLVLQNCIFPQCDDSSHELQLRFVCVYKLGTVPPLEEYELGMDDLASPVAYIINSDPCVSKNIKTQLSRYAQEDIYRVHPFYECVFVYSNLEFEKLAWYN